MKVWADGMADAYERDFQTNNADNALVWMRVYGLGRLFDLKGMAAPV